MIWNNEPELRLQVSQISTVVTDLGSHAHHQIIPVHLANNHIAPLGLLSVFSSL